MLILRKTIPESIKELTIYEILELLSSWKFRGSYNPDLYFDVINNIENNNFQMIDLSDTSMIDHCQKTLALAIKLDMCTEKFCANFINLLTNYQNLINKAYFARLTYGGISCRILTKLGNHETISMVTNERIRVNYTPINDCVFDYCNGNWFVDNARADNIMSASFDKYKRGIMIIRQLLYVMVINQFYIPNDIKYYMKRFLLLDKEIKFA